MIRCAWFLTDLRGGGAERLPLLLAPALIRARLTVILLKREVEHALPEGSPEIVRLSTGTRRLRENVAALLLRAIRAARDHDVIVGGAEGAPVLFAAVVAALVRKPLLTIVHTDIPALYGRDPIPSWAWMLHGMALRASRAIVAVSEDARAGLVRLGIRSEVIRVIPNPVRAPRRSTGSGGLVPRVITVASLQRVKGIDLVLEAAARLGDASFEWTVIGDGPEREAYEARARALGVESRVRFVGFDPKPEAWYENADLFVLPSRVEGMGLALHEAMAAGLPIVATRCGKSVEEALGHGTAGRLVPVEDAVAMAEAIRELLADRETAWRLGREAHARSSQDDPVHAARAYEQLLESVISPGHDGGPS